MRPLNPLPVGYWTTPPPMPASRPTYAVLPRLAVVGLSASLYVVACATPALVFSGRGIETWFGFEALLIGWLGAFLGHFAWYANLLLPIAWLLLVLRRSTAAIATTLFALLIAADTFRLYNGEIPGDEAGVTKLHFEYPHVGFAFWVLSMVVVLVGAVWFLVHDRITRRTQTPGA